MTPFLSLLALLAPQDLRTERVYYDEADADGRLTGGVVELASPANPKLFPATLAPVHTLAASGAPANRVDIVFVGDGYQAGELGVYAGHVASQTAIFFQEEPFAEYADYFNVHQVDVVSVDSGVDNDPTQGIQRDTALNMGFWCSGIERLLCVSVSLAYSHANNAPDVDLVAAIANSTKYGGAGYISSDLATASGGNGSAAEILLHEFGHALGDLADEYHYGDGATYSGGEVGEPNVSIRTAAQMTAQMTKWFRWVGTVTPGFDGLVDSFEGARYHQFGIYRPTNNSLMRSLGRPFNMPSVEAVVLEIYAIVSPIDAASSTAAVYDGTETLFVTPMQPASHSLDVQWALDGNDISGATGTTLDLCSLDLAPGQHTVSATVVDNTSWVRDEAARASLMSQTLQFAVDSGGPYCIAAANSAGPGALMGSRGSVSQAAADFVLTVDGVPPSVFGLFFHGNVALQAPFGNGFRCVGGATKRLGVQQVDASGHAERAFDPVSQGIPPSQERLFQFWYRDGAAGGAAFNTSDGYAVTFCP